MQISLISDWLIEKLAHLAMRMMIRIGSLAIVIRNIASGGPNARNAQPKNSRRAMFLGLLKNQLNQTVLNAN